MWIISVSLKNVNTVNKNMILKYEIKVTDEKGIIQKFVLCGKMYFVAN